MKLRAQSQMVRHSRGFTLIEIAIVLTIVGLIIGGIWVAASTVFNNNKAQALSRDVIQVVQNTKSLFAGQGAQADTTSFSAANAIAAGIFPPDMIAGTHIITPFNVDPNTDGVTVTAVPTNQITYVFGTAAPNGLPSNACTQLLTTLGSLNNIQKLGISTLEGTSASDLTSGGTAQVNAAAAAGACTATSNANSVSVTFSVF